MNKYLLYTYICMYVALCAHKQYANISSIFIYFDAEHKYLRTLIPKLNN